MSPNFLVSFMFVLDDLWYYQYHRWDDPPSAKFFMDKVDIINDLRLDPWFFSFF